MVRRQDHRSAQRGPRRAGGISLTDHRPAPALPRPAPEGDHAPLPERLDAIAGRLEATATYLEEAKTRATVPQVRRWQQIEIETAAELPAFFDEIEAAGDGTLPAVEQRRLKRASESAKLAI